MEDGKSVYHKGGKYPYRAYGKCPYREGRKSPCHLQVEALPKDKWKDEPGVVIVDAYADRWRKKRELDAEIKGVEGELDELRRAAIVFAEKEGVQVIAGTEARLRVTGKERVVSPAKGSAEREALERELRVAGVWDEVSTLDASALEKAVAEGKWGPEVLERIKAYVSTEKRYTVTLKEESQE